MTSKALLFGLNYMNDPGYRLDGCINDTINVRTLLIDHLGFSPEDILVCTDETTLKPTKNMMLRLLRELVLSTHRMTINQIFISYSGHGINIGSKDDALVPLDSREFGIITDYDLAALIRQVHPRTDVIFLIDACHSGSMCNLPYIYTPDGFKEDETMVVSCRALLISGCRDDQTSAESPKDTGVATNAFIHALEHHNYDVTCTNLIRYMNQYMQDNHYPQRPQLSSSRKLFESCVFVTSSEDGRPFFVL